ncbi:MAG: helix-turn-helix transcriptional regulator [Paenarthrobacter sp.]
MTTNPAFGQYLQARRGLVRPEDAGLADFGRRRVPGLRREEVAGLAGISVDYYVRLEQGKDHHPSAQILDALARALRLDPPSTLHLHRLAQGALQPATTGIGVTGVGTGMAYLLKTLAHVPAFVQDRYMNVLAANRLAIALSPRNKPGTNVLREAFLDPAEQQLYEDWELVMEEATAGLRAAVGESVNDPQLEKLVEELTHRSAYFLQLWGRHDVRPKVAGKRKLHHPVAGDLELFHEKLSVAGTEGHLLVIHHAEPGSSSEAALQKLANTITD